MTVWHASQMERITRSNRNDRTPTACHFSFVQYFVRDHQLHAYHYQRSADVLLGLPHNFIQHWALLLYFAHHAKLSVGSLRYQLGDAHLYQDQTHITTTHQLLACTTHPELDNSFELVYNPEHMQESEVPELLVSDYVMHGTIPEPVVQLRPRLL
jgi:thymidylate synthase